MSNPRLPVEMLDHVVDHLHDTKRALRNCCLVSRSWIPRTRKHLFVEVKLQTKKHLESWKEMFPDPSTSPARYTKTLFIDCTHLVAASDAGADGWIRGFSRVVHFWVGSRLLPSMLVVSLAPFHGFSPIKSLHVDLLVLPSSEVLDLILSFPLLEDLSVSSCSEGSARNRGGSGALLTAVRPPSSPVFSGSLELSMEGGMRPIARRLLSLPGSIHFRKLALVWAEEEDIVLIAAFVERCSRTLESLDITCNPRGTPIRLSYPHRSLFLFPVEPESTSIDLSKATRLGAVAFRVNSCSVEWVTTALQTIPPENQDLRQISIHPPFHLTSAGADVEETVVDRIFWQWLDLDRLFVRFWEERSISPKVVCTTLNMGNQGTARDCIGRLLPEITMRGIIDLVE